MNTGSLAEDYSGCRTEDFAPLGGIFLKACAVEGRPFTHTEFWSVLPPYPRVCHIDQMVWAHHRAAEFRQTGIERIREFCA